MNVLYIAPRYPSASDPCNGIMVQEFAHALRKEGIELRIITLYGEVLWPFSKMKRYQFKVDNSDDVDWVLRHRVKYLPLNAGILLRSRLWSRTIVHHVCNKWPDFRPDIVHGRTFIPGAVIAQRIADYFNCPTVVSTHGVDTRVYINRLLMRSQIRNSCIKSNAVVCVSDTIKSCLVKNNVNADKLFVIYNGMDLSKLQPCPSELSQRYRDKFLVVGVGNLKATKGFDLFIEAIGRLKSEYPNLHGVIVGDGVEKKKLNNLISRLNLKDSIDMVGFQTSEEVMKYLAACNLFCLPSWSEGFGIVYLEAMASGKAVIGVEGQGISKIVSENKTGLLVQPHDVNAVADAIKYFIDRPDIRNQMGKRGKEVVWNNYSWNHCAVELIRLYEKILQSK